MKKNKEFSKFLELKTKYKEQPTKAKKEEVQTEVKRLISLGYATPTLQVVFDLGIEKYRTIGFEDMAIKIYDKDKSVRGIMRRTYGEFLPKGATDLIPFKELVFNPFKPQTFVSSGVDYANLFIPSKFLSMKMTADKMIDSIDWNKYPYIGKLFENVFKSEERMNYFVNWLSYGFQTKKKSGVAILSKGIQGTGKGIIFEFIIQYAIGERYVTIITNDSLKSKFNGELENRLFVLANEIKADFREGNTTYEKIKTYIADSIIRFEEKNIRSRPIPNYFNMWFHSNNDVPLQIQGGDRRYTVFNTKSKKLTEVSKELGFKHISFFIEEIKKERDSFIEDLMCLKYDMTLATTPLSTEEKELIYESSMTKVEVLTDKIKSHDIEYFRDGIDDFYSSSDLSEVRQELFRTLQIENSMDLIVELQKQFSGNHIKNDLSRILYKIFVNENEADRKIGLQLNKHFGKAILKNNGGIRFKYRRINEDENVNFIEKIPLVIEEPNGMIKNHTLDLTTRN